MSLNMFKFIEDTIECFEKRRPSIEIISKEVEDYFDRILKAECEGYININSRVKSCGSLKEKILRNNYYKKDLDAEELLDNISDLIGIRLECRFIKDEDEIYKIIKEHFNSISDDKNYYNSENNKIGLELKGIQPQTQKNGFKIYRIDGIWNDGENRVKFELQIKALVNIFWSEIEHKIIYKNNSYMLIDSFIKDIMVSIKKNLTMIDHQLLVTYNQFNSKKLLGGGERNEQFEKLLSKIIYDTYALKMSKSIGFVVDFKKPCDTIMKYFLRSRENDYSNRMIKTLERVSEIHSIETKFDDEILFERDIVFNDEFSMIVGNKILDSINNEFQWNLFFRIIFEIEPGNNAEDFETFIGFLRDSFMNNEGFVKFDIAFGEEGMKEIKNKIMGIISNAFIEVGSIEFIIENTIDEINNTITDGIDRIYKKGISFEEWKNNEEIYLEILYIKVLAVCDFSVDTKRIIKLLDKIQKSSNFFKINSLLFKYLSSLESLDKINCRDVVKFILA